MLFLTAHMHRRDKPGDTNAEKTDQMPKDPVPLSTEADLHKKCQENTATLRKLFVQQLVRYKEKYQRRLGNLELAKEEIQCLMGKGANYNDIGNLVCPIMTDVLRISIVIVTSLSNFPTVMFNSFIGTVVTTDVMIFVIIIFHCIMIPSTVTTTQIGMVYHVDVEYTTKVKQCSL